MLSGPRVLSGPGSVLSGPGSVLSGPGSVLSGVCKDQEVPYVFCVKNLFCAN